MFMFEIVFKLTTAATVVSMQLYPFAAVSLPTYLSWDSASLRVQGQVVAPSVKRLTSIRKVPNSNLSGDQVN